MKKKEKKVIILQKCITLHKILAMIQETTNGKSTILTIDDIASVNHSLIINGKREIICEDNNLSIPIRTIFGDDNIVIPMNKIIEASQRTMENLINNCHHERISAI